MRYFSKQIANFLKKVGVDSNKRVNIVPKSKSAIRPGAVLFFKYKRPKRQGYDILLVVSPVVKDAKTGNKLFTGFKVPSTGDYDVESLEDLYNNKALPQENYRTYILSKIVGPVRRVV